MSQNERTFYVAALEALDAMEDKRLIKGSMEDIDGCRCFAGQVMHHLDPNLPTSELQLVTFDEDVDYLSKTFNLKRDFVLSAIRQNDGFGDDSRECETKRWTHMRDWTETQLELLEAA